MITVHHLESSRSQRVLWLLEELALPYQLVRYARDPKTLLAPPSLRAIHPLGKSPVLVDDGHTLAESGAILEYLVERYDTGHALSPTPLPVDSPERLQYRYWMHYAEGSAMPPLLMTLVFARIRSAPMPFFVRPVARRIADTAMKSFVGPQLATHLGYVERELGAHAWFAGDRFTAADIQMSFPLEAAVARAGIDGGEVEDVVFGAALQQGVGHDQLGVRQPVKGDQGGLVLAVQVDQDVAVFIAGQHALEPLAALDHPVGFQTRLLALEQVEVDGTGQGPVDAGRRHLEAICTIDWIGRIEHRRERPRADFAILDRHRAVGPLGHHLHGAALGARHAHAHQAIARIFKHRLHDRGDAGRQSWFNDQALLGALMGLDSLGHPACFGACKPSVCRAQPEPWWGVAGRFR